MNQTRQFIVMYDITDARILQRVAKLMERSGYVRINYSVWLGMKDPMQDDELKRWICGWLKKPEACGSRVYCLPIPGSSLAAMRMIDGKKPDELDYWTNQRKNMFF
jgi:CRISPR-associated endonuclease Cas2